MVQGGRTNKCKIPPADQAKEESLKKIFVPQKGGLIFAYVLILLILDAVSKY